MPPCLKRARFCQLLSLSFLFLPLKNLIVFLSKGLKQSDGIANRLPVLASFLKSKLSLGCLPPHIHLALPGVHFLGLFSWLTPSHTCFNAQLSCHIYKSSVNAQNPKLQTSLTVFSPCRRLSWNV